MVFPGAGSIGGAQAEYRGPMTNNTATQDFTALLRGVEGSAL
jgi:hypothetical protein